MKTQVGITFGGKELDCELEYDGRAGRNNYEFTLVKVEMVMSVERKECIPTYTCAHSEDITEFLEEVGASLCVGDGLILESLEERCIEAIQERGYV